MSEKPEKCDIKCHCWGGFPLEGIARKPDRNPRFNIDIFSYGNSFKEPIAFGKDEKKRKYEKVILLFERPIKIDELQKFREHVIAAADDAADAAEIKTISYPIPVDGEFVREKIDKCIDTWCAAPKTEKCSLKRKSYVQLPSKSKDSPMHLYASAMTGKMGDLLLRLQQIAKQYVKEIESIVKPSLQQRIKELGDAICNSKQPEGELSHEYTPTLPKVLLLGDSGVGKSLVANFLHQCVQNLLEEKGMLEKPKRTSRPARIAIPEFLEKADDFEYRLFGYTKGAFTGAKEEGDIGLLAQNMGQVVFLDEIGTADSTIQAKLLAYLDDYKIRPRGWQKIPFLCPILVVAATNEESKLKNKDIFRNDLLARFTDELKIPNLKERIDGDKETFNYILDCVLQEKAILQYGIEEIGEGAWRRLWDHFSNGCDGNFRELENCIRDACKHARADKRNQLIAADIAETTSPTVPVAATPSFRVSKGPLKGLENKIISRGFDANHNQTKSADDLCSELQQAGFDCSIYSIRRFMTNYKKWLKTH